MPKKPAVPVLQVLWEPWPDTDEGAWNRDGYEAFAGRYWLDALEPDGTFTVKGYRAMFAGCTTCRRDASDPKIHVPNINDLKPKGPRRKCPTWKTIDAVVKTFGGVEARALCGAGGERKAPVPAGTPAPPGDRAMRHVRREGLHQLGCCLERLPQVPSRMRFVRVRDERRSTDHVRRPGTRRPVQHDRETTADARLAGKTDNQKERGTPVDKPSAGVLKLSLQHHRVQDQR